jgi:hypothetical protein
MEIKLGSKVRDIVSGFEGIATSEVKYLNGCKQYCVAGRSVEGKEGVNIYFDHAQLELVDEGITVKMSDTGGPSIYQPKS